MPLPDPVFDVRSLDLLRSVAREGSIQRAAATHNVSQPAASMRLRTLERAVGLDLLDRSRSKARLTPLGIALVQWSEPVLEGMRDLLLAVEAARADGRTHLRVAASMTVAEYLIPASLSRLRALNPDLVISLRMGNSEQVAAVMVEGGADLGFVEGHRIPAALTSRVVQSDELVVVVAPGHSWARRRTMVGPDEVARTPIILREVGSGTREVFETALSAAGMNARVLFELGSTTAIKSAVALGEGPGVLSRLAVAADVAAGRLIVVRVEGLALGRPIRAVWLRGRSLSPAAKRLLQEIVTVAETP